MRVVHPLRPALPKRHEGEALTVARHETQAVLDCVEQLVVRRRGAFEDHHRCHVHVGGGVLQMEEGGV
jgi:hypothetical protein